MDGSLDVTVNCGNVDVYLSRHEKVNIKVSSGKDVFNDHKLFYAWEKNDSSKNLIVHD